MTVDELSDRFDVLLNSYANPSQFSNDTTHTNIVLDEYEKSLFLTESLDELVVSLYNGNNPYGLSFESTEEARSYLYLLQECATLTNGLSTTLNSNNITEFNLPVNLMFITLEDVNYKVVDCNVRKDVEVVPITQDEWHKIKKNPFKGPSYRRVLRMDVGENSGRRVKLISKYPIKSYTIYYIRKPNPILCVDLAYTQLTIRGEYRKSTSIDLPEILHDTLLRNAVQKAITSKGMARTNNKE